MRLVEGSNLMSHRAATSVWDKRGWREPTIEERLVPWLITLGSAGVVALGASRRWRGASYLAAGAALIGCVAAVWPPHEVKFRLLRWRQHATEADPVTIEAMDSFPASDAPSSNATTIFGGRPISAYA
jgi:hypothetical protein